MGGDEVIYRYRIVDNGGDEVIDRYKIVDNGER